MLRSRHPLLLPLGICRKICRSKSGYSIDFDLCEFPGRFGEWCAAALAAVAGVAGGPVLSQVHPALDEMCAYNAVPRTLRRIALTLIRFAPEQLVIEVRQPDETLRAVLAETGVRFVLALEDRSRPLPTFCPAWV